jgi:hypothetical protein
MSCSLRPPSFALDAEFADQLAVAVRIAAQDLAEFLRVDVAVSTPIDSILALTSGSAIARLISLFKRVTSSAGMFFGPKAPYQTESS